jgi:hypothetical protein
LEGGNRGFVVAGELQVGDIIFTEDGSETIITAIAPGAEYDYVYNIEVDNFHTYVADGIRVHNYWWGWGGWWGGYYGWGWPYSRRVGYNYGTPGTGIDGIGSGAVGSEPVGGTGAVFVIY